MTDPQAVAMTTIPEGQQWFRQWTPSWDRAGWANKPHHAGQPPCRDGMDFPEGCPVCGGAIVGTGIPLWLKLRGLGPTECHTGSDYVAWCGKGHRIDLQPVGRMIAQAQEADRHG